MVHCCVFRYLFFGHRVLTSSNFPFLFVFFSPSASTFCRYIMKRLYENGFRLFGMQHQIGVMEAVFLSDGQIVFPALGFSDTDSSAKSY